MRRLLVGCFISMFMIVAASPAEAAVKSKVYDLAGPLSTGGTVSFHVLVKKKGKHGKFKPKRVGDFFFDDVTVNCDDGAKEIDVSTGAILGVTNGAFSYDFSTFTAHFDGQLTKPGKAATGVFDFGPAEVSGSPNCTTGGPQSWSANRV